MTHGYTSDTIWMFQNFCIAYAKWGYAVFAADLIGHGRSNVRLVIDPWTRESSGFGFVSMSSIKEADSCIKYLDGSVLDGRVITVERCLF
ncbi:putative RNA recognition motif domain, nucleotide-binding alpha-beta plait domain superfamily [Helianthus annuus]|nr:putative RNA recognition motif domain, nucleotide-binding alpha-beta plait domain superfamily [Helianthus annuus]KAJ0750254.1 putative RNA recognition motif domain, nucleotide-binding alpha-beta plait domain superfamily [Helianthus annuus]